MFRSDGGGGDYRYHGPDDEFMNAPVASSGEQEQASASLDGQRHPTTSLGNPGALDALPMWYTREQAVLYALAVGRSHLKVIEPVGGWAYYVAASEQDRDRAEGHLVRVQFPQDPFECSCRHFDGLEYCWHQALVRIWLTRPEVLSAGGD